MVNVRRLLGFATWLVLVGGCGDSGPATTESSGGSTAAQGSTSTPLPTS